VLIVLQGSRCYYVRESLANLATSVARDNLLSLGICLGKFTKTGKFRLHITALSVIAPHARYKVWVKANGEMPFLYGGNVLKAHVGRWSEDCPEHQGVIVLSMNDTPLGFGVSARSTAEARKLDPTGIVTFRQADIGEYLRGRHSLHDLSGRCSRESVSQNQGKVCLDGKGTIGCTGVQDRCIPEYAL
jgi:60S ribosome subunit biogenesis protein NIP7